MIKSLQLRFLLAVLVGAVLFAAIAATLAYRVAFNRAIDNGRATLEGLIVAVENTAAIGAYASDKVLLQEVVDGLAHNPLSLSVSISDPAGHVLARRSDSTTAPTTDVAVQQALHSPFDKSEIIGHLKIEANMTQLKAVARSEALTLTLMIVAQTVAVAMLLYLLAARLVSAPIINLSDKLRRMRPGAGERLTRPKLHHHDEIGTLIDSANALLQANDVALQRERDLRMEIEVMEAQYRKIFDSSSAGIFVLDDGGRLINCNPTALKIIGVTEDAKSLHDADFIAHAFDHPAQVLDMIAEATQSGNTVEADLRLRSADGLVRWVHCLVSVQPASAHPPPEGQAPSALAAPGSMVEGVMYDITERKQAEKATQHRAEHDSLTGLKNRAAADAAIERMLNQAAAEGTSFSVLYIDLDGFKRVNDVLGHKAGDQVLIHCARRMRQAVRRANDLIARIGGDEFLVALEGTGPMDDNLAQVASAIVTGLCEPITLDDGGVARIGASIGMASYPRHGSTGKLLLQAADAAMYDVKRTGKNSFALACLPPSLTDAT